MTSFFGWSASCMNSSSSAARLAAVIAVEAVHASGEAQKFGAGEAAEQRHAFGHDADLALDFDRMRR